MKGLHAVKDFHNDSSFVCESVDLTSKSRPQARSFHGQNRYFSHLMATYKLKFLLDLDF